MYGDDEGAAVLEPLSVVGLTEHVREVEELANVLDAATGQGARGLGEQLPIDLVRVRLRVWVRVRGRVRVRFWVRVRGRVRVRFWVRVRVSVRVRVRVR